MVEVGRAAVGGKGTRGVTAFCQDVAHQHVRARVLGVEGERGAGGNKRLVRPAGRALHERQIPVQERRVRRGDDRGMIRGASLIPASRRRGPLRAAHTVLRHAHSQRLDAARQLGKIRIGSDRGFEAGERGVVAARAEQREPASHERGRIRASNRQGSLEVRQRLLRPLACQGHIAGGGLGRREVGGRLQHGRKLAVGRGHIVGLQQAPAAGEPIRCRGGRARWWRRIHEVWILRRRRHRHDPWGGCATCDRDARRQHPREPTHGPSSCPLCATSPAR